MKQLETQFTESETNNTLTLVKRGVNTLVYKRATHEDAFVQFEVFAIKSKDGSEVYPPKSAFGKWAWCPITQKKADSYFNRIETGEVAIPDCDPITGEITKLVNDVSLEELLSEPDVDPVIIVDDLTTPIVNEPVIVDTGTPEVLNTIVVDTDIINPTPVVDVADPTVVPTTDGGMVVAVAKVSKKKNQSTQIQMVIPTGEFTQATFAIANGLPVRGIVWSRLDGLVQGGKLSKSLKQVGRGRPTAFYIGI